MYNYNYGKLKDGNLTYAPRGGMFNGIYYSEFNDIQIKSLGYMPIELTPAPTDDNIYSYSWIIENAKIKQIWTMTHQTTNAERRERLYETSKCVIIDDKEAMTVDEANNLWLKYMAEGNAYTNTISEAIAEAKAKIREDYPDENLEAGDNNGAGESNRASES